MPRDEKTVHPRDAVTDPPLAPPATPPSGGDKPPLAIFDPYSQRVIACSRPGGAAAIPDRRPVPAAGGASAAVRVLQLALLSSVAVVIWFMLSVLRAAG
jgi:hypothetical protein